MEPGDPSGRVIVLGASAGGVESLSSLVSQLARDLPAAVLVVLHMPQGSTSVLPHILEGAGPMPARFAERRQRLRPGTILIAPPGRHLLIEGSDAVLDAGPRDNGQRPAIDPLFVSAARSLRRDVAGGLLSGSLDDGVTGLAVIKEEGGRAYVQHPDETRHPSMVLHAIERVSLDGVLRIEDLAQALTRFAREPAAVSVTTSGGEAAGIGDPSADQDDGMEQLQREGTLTGFTCPACGGAIWGVEQGRTTSFRCHVGHGYSPEVFAAEHAGAVEQALWAAVRALEEKEELLRRLAQSARESGRQRSARAFLDQSGEVHRHVATVRRVAGSTSAIDPGPVLNEPGDEELSA